MNSEFFEALALLEKEKGIPAEYFVEKITNAIVIAVRRDYDCLLYTSGEQSVQKINGLGGGQS